jgi:hypothetical protein
MVESIPRVQSAINSKITVVFYMTARTNVSEYYDAFIFRVKECSYVLVNEVVSIYFVRSLLGLFALFILRYCSTFWPRNMNIYIFFLIQCILSVTLYNILTISQPSSVIFLYCLVYTYLWPDMFRPHTRPSSEAYV